MDSETILEILLQLTQHTAEIAALYNVSKGRELTPDEIAVVRDRATAAIAKLSATP